MLRSRLNNRSGTGVGGELQALIDEDGTITPKQIVARARVKGTALHARFERAGLWNDAKAAEKARLDFAAKLIHFYVNTRTIQGKEIVCRPIVSLMQDRGTGIRRRLEDVMNSPSMRDNLLETALMELRAFHNKYEKLVELSEVWVAALAVETRLAAQRKRVRAKGAGATA